MMILLALVVFVSAVMVLFFVHSARVLRRFIYFSAALRPVVKFNDRPIQGHPYRGMVPHRSTAQILSRISHDSQKISLIDFVIDSAKREGFNAMPQSFYDRYFDYIDSLEDETPTPKDILDYAESRLEEVGVKVQVPEVYKKGSHPTVIFEIDGHTYSITVSDPRNFFDFYHFMQTCIDRGCDRVKRVAVERQAL